MKATLLTISILITSVCLGQSGWSRVDRNAFKEADFAFYQEDYASAYPVFTDLLKKYPDHGPLLWRCGACQIEVGENHGREAMLLKAIEKGENEARFYLARHQHLNYELTVAMENFALYKQIDDRDMKDATVDRYINMCQQALRNVAQPRDIVLQNVGPAINTEFKEYVPVISGNGKELYFTSRRPGSTAQLKDPHGEFYEDIYYSTREGDAWSQAVNAGLALNSETHDATVALAANGSSMIIYRTNENQTGGDLLISDRKGKEWSKPKKLDKSINSDFQEASACLSANGTMMIFSSNRPGGYGGKDLYRVKRLPNGQWSLPKNLGPVINGPFDEDAPFLDSDDKKLYFASNGHTTMGGYDIFTSRMMGPESWSVPENIGYPLNTVEDDIYLVVEPGGKSGYISSNREDGFGQLDIYRVDFIYRQNIELVVKSEILDANASPISATITVLDGLSNEIQGIYNTHPHTGKFIMVLNPLTRYKLFIEADGYPTVEDEMYFEFPEGSETNFRIAPFMLMK